MSNIEKVNTCNENVLYIYSRRCSFFPQIASQILWGGAVTQGVVGGSSGVCRGQGSQIQDRAVVTQGVVGGVIF